MKKIGTIAKVIGGAVIVYGLYAIVKASVMTVAEYIGENNSVSNKGYVQTKVRPDTKMSDIAGLYDDEF